MTSRTSALRRTAHRIFRALPRGVRSRLVRTLTPNYTVGAVVLVHDTGGALLLLRQPPGWGWSLPGGLLGRREDPAHGAARELAEETGIEVAPTALVPASPNARVNTSAQQVDIVFTLTVERPDGNLAIDPVEVLEAGWYQPSDLPPLTVATARTLALYGIGPYTGFATDGSPSPEPPQDSTSDRAVTTLDHPKPDQPSPDKREADQATPDQASPGEPANGQSAAGQPSAGKPTPDQASPGEPANGQSTNGQPSPGAPTPDQPSPGEPANGQTPDHPANGRPNR
jgi:ADP-ribose pyrophosphatase YjhB (NUDIX family)